MSASAANSLTQAALRAKDEGDFEIVGILYVRGRRIEGYQFLRNLSKVPGSFECSRREYKTAVEKAPRWATSTIFFHSHLLSSMPSCTDVRAAALGQLNLIYNCSGNEFILYYYPRSVRQEAKIRDTWRNSNAVETLCRKPLYVETGIRSFDATVIQGKKHPRLITSLRKEMHHYLWERIRILKEDGSAVVVPARHFQRETVLTRLFEGLEYYIDFRKMKKSKKQLNGLSSFYETDFLVTAYELLFSLLSYTISQEKDWLANSS